jgi:uncharacterized membrane protein
METVLNWLQALDLHPVADHFTISLLVIGVAIDLVASLAPTRTWVRYTALTLMVLGAIAAGCSYGTGDMEADRVWKAIGKEAQAVLHRHAELGEYMAITFGVLAVWRILIEGIGFFAGSRPLYLVVAIIAAVVLLYTGKLGGELVYTYAVGTAVMGQQPPYLSPSTTASPTPLPNSALPTVSVPTASAAETPAPIPTAAPTLVTPVEPPKAETPTPQPTPTAGISGTPPR